MKDSLFFSQYGLHFLIIPGTAPGSGSPGRLGAARSSAFFSSSAYLLLHLFRQAAVFSKHVNVAFQRFRLFAQRHSLVPDEDSGPSLAVAGLLNEIFSGRVAVHCDDDGRSALEDFIVKALVDSGALALRRNADTDVFLQDTVPLGTGNQ